MVSAAWNSLGIIAGSRSASTFASGGDFKRKLTVKWLWLITGLLEETHEGAHAL